MGGEEIVREHIVEHASVHDRAHTDIHRGEQGRRDIDQVHLPQVLPLPDAGSVQQEQRRVENQGDNPGICSRLNRRVRCIAEAAVAHHADDSIVAGRLDEPAQPVVKLAGGLVDRFAEPAPGIRRDIVEVRECGPPVDRLQ